MRDPLSERLGTATPRIDGVAKVTGAARYASDEPVPRPVFAYLVTSSIARGRIGSFDLGAARAVNGVVEIFTHENIGTGFKPPLGPDGGPTTTILDSDRIWHAGQIIAVVVAESYEAARESAHRVRVSYLPETASATFDSPGATTEEHKPQRGPDPHKGDAASAYDHAEVKFEADYSTPTQHHNPIELFTNTSLWDEGKLTVYEPSQFMVGLKSALATQLNVEPAKVRTVSRFIGGAFGSKGPHARSHWFARVARRVGRPVKLVPTRDQGFTIATYRAETRQRIRLSASRDGKLQSLSHAGWEVTSRPSGYNVSGTETTARIYACPNIHTAVNVVHADRSTPGFMRAPPETPYMFALESAMDELAYALKLDPIELRRINDTQNDPVDGKPYSSRSLMQCFDQAAARFGWSKRNPTPASMRADDWQVGYGCATACYPSNVGPAAARVALLADGRAEVAIAGHEIGTGAYTTVAVITARALGLSPDRVSVQMGDSDLPPLMIAGGSNNAASASLVVANACEQIRDRLARAAVAASDSALHGLDPTSLVLNESGLTDGAAIAEPLSVAMSRTGHRLEVYAENIPGGLPPTAMADLMKGKAAMLSGSGRKDVVAYAFGAHFVEVRVHSLTREVRVQRVVSAFAVGTVINTMTAYSQLMSGTIWGLSAALHEATEIDHASARFVNTNLADYLVPVNADIPAIDIILVPEADDRVNSLGIKGIGEIGIVGMNAAVANAVYHATARRIRDLPIRTEKLL